MFSRLCLPISSVSTFSTPPVPLSIVSLVLHLPSPLSHPPFLHELPPSPFSDNSYNHWPPAASWIQNLTYRETRKTNSTHTVCHKTVSVARLLRTCNIQSLSVTNIRHSVYSKLQTSISLLQCATDLCHSTYLWSDNYVTKSSIYQYQCSLRFLTNLNFDRSRTRDAVSDCGPIVTINLNYKIIHAVTKIQNYTQPGEILGGISCLYALRSNSAEVNFVFYPFRGR